MNRKNYILLLILLLPCLAVAQIHTQAHKDSLVNATMHAEGKDRLRAYQLLTNIYYFAESGSDDLKMDTLLTLYNQMFDEAVRQKDIGMQGVARANSLFAFSNRQEYDKILRLAPDYIDYFERMESWKYYYPIYQKYIQTFFYSGDLDRGLAEAKKMYEKAMQRKHNDGMGLALFSMSNAYCKMERHVEEEQCMRQSIEILKKESGKLPVVAEGYFFLLQSLYSQERYEDILKEAGNFEQIIYLYEEDSKSPQPTAWVNLYRNLISAYIKLGDYDRAESYCLKMDNLPHTMYGDPSLAEDWGRIYAGRGKYQKALEMFDRAIELLGDYHIGEREINIPKLKAEVLAKMGRAEEVHRLWEHIYSVNDSIRTLEINAQLDELRIQYEVDKITIEKIRNRNYFLLAIGGCLLLLIVLGIWIYYSRNLARKNRELVRKNQQWAGVEALEKQSEDETDTAPDETDSLLMNEIEIWMAKGLYKDPNLTLDILAKKIGTNQTYISKTISRCTGKNFRTCINEYRVKEAIRILSDDCKKNHSINDLAFESGFNDRNTFHRVFKKMTGLSPSDFRKNRLG